ncbi:MAG: methyltransferase domain-containing protein [Caulobacteraceae bacterium]
MSLAPQSDAANAAQIDYWNAATGETWAALNDRLDRTLEPLGRAAMEALAPGPGERLIDIGCGCGKTTFDLAGRVGDKGHVIGVDVSAPMLRIARARAGPAGALAATFLQADAQTHAFDRGAADGAFSRFGVMFFADPAAAFANIRAALAPGGRLAFVCWRPMSENPMMALPLAAALPHLPEPPPPPDPLAPGPFAFADPRRVRAILSRAGFTHIDIAPRDQPITTGDLDQAVDMAQKIGPLGFILRENPDLRGAVIDAIRAALAAFSTPSGVFLNTATWIVTARNAGVAP